MKESITERGAQTYRSKYADIKLEIEGENRGIESVLTSSPMIYKREDKKEQGEEILDVSYIDVEESWLEVQLWELFVLTVNGILSMMRFLIVVIIPLILSGCFFVVKWFFKIVKIFLLWIVKMLTKEKKEMTKEMTKDQGDFDGMDYGGKFVIVNYGSNVNIQVNQKN